LLYGRSRLYFKPIMYQETSTVYKSALAMLTKVDLNLNNEAKIYLYKNTIFNLQKFTK